MKRIIFIAMCILSCISSSAQQNQNDTIVVSNIETEYKGKVSLSVKNVVNITYKFVNDDNTYEVVVYGSKPTIISEGLATIMKYEIKKCVLNDKVIKTYSHIAVKPNVVISNGVVIKTTTIVLYKK